MNCPRCGAGIPYYRRETPACDCGWAAPVKKRAGWALSGIIFLLVAAAVCCAGVVVVNLHRWFPDDAAASKHLANGKDYMARQKYDFAVYELQQAVEANPNRADIRLQLFRALYKTNAMANAVEQMKVAASLTPADYRMQEGYGEALESMDEQEAALAQFERVMEKFPGDYICREHAALCAERTDKQERAIALWQEVLKMNPNATEAYVNKARICMRQRKPEAAVETFKQGLKQMPSNAILYYHLGICYMEMKNRAAATEALKKSAELEPAYTESVAGQVERLTQDEKRPTYMVPLHKSGYNQLWVEVVLNEKRRVRLQVDSGAGSTVISTHTARELGLDLNKLPRTEFMSETGTDLAWVASLKTVRVGTARATDVRVLIYDSSGPDFDGLLGMSFLNQFKFTIDTAHRQLVLIPR